LLLVLNPATRHNNWDRRQPQPQGRADPALLQR
jgi:hypothetical protein